MNKFLLALPILVFPLIAQAEDKPTQAPEAMIQATERMFLPKYCAKGLEGLAADVYDCYQQIKSSDPKQEECLIADDMVTAITTNANKKAIELGQTPQYSMPFFTYLRMAQRARDFRDNTSKFENYTTPEFATYLANTVKMIINDESKLYKETNGNCSAYFKP